MTIKQWARRATDVTLLKIATAFNPANWPGEEADATKLREEVVDAAMNELRRRSVRSLHA